MTDTLTPPSATGGEFASMSLMEHLIELRGRLIKCAIAVAIGAALGWFLYSPVLHTLMHPLNDLAKDNPKVGADFLSTDPLEIFLLRIKLSAYLGIVVAMPFLLWQLWSFIAPGLYQNERRYASAFVASATVLFLMGASIAYFTLAPALEFLQSVGGGDVVYQYSAQSYLMLVVYMMLAFGAGFQFPIVLVFLQLVGVLTPKQLAGWRRFACVAIFVVAAVITPSADPISLFALAIPMLVLYEIAILVGRLVMRRRRHAAAAAES